MTNIPETEKNILQYLYTNLNYKNNHEMRLFLNNSSILSSNTQQLLYLNINITNYDKLLDALHYYQLNLINGAIIHLNNWYKNITNKGVYHAFQNWAESLNFSHLIEFPVIHWNEKAFIYVKNN